MGSLMILLRSPHGKQMPKVTMAKVNILADIDKNKDVKVEDFTKENYGEISIKGYECVINTTYPLASTGGYIVVLLIGGLSIYSSAVIDSAGKVDTGWGDDAKNVYRVVNEGSFGVSWNGENHKKGDENESNGVQTEGSNKAVGTEVEVTAG